eukprot:27659-Ditylum_brightwellii.AAC.1
MPVPKAAMGSSAKLMIPVILLMAREIQFSESRCLLKVLLDSVSDHTMIHARALPLNVIPPKSNGGTRRMQALAGVLETSREVSVKDTLLPVFDKTKRVDCIAAH